MYTNERLQEIMNIVRKQGFSTVKYLSNALHISPSSIRRDLTFLEQRGLVSRSYGGVELCEFVSKNISFSLRTQEKLNEKKRITAEAAKLVKDGYVVFTDASSTCFLLLKELLSARDITVITNSVDGLALVSDYNIKVISTGGIISSENRSALVGSWTEKFFMNSYADIAFFSTQAIDENGSIYDCSLAEIAAREQMLAHSKQKVYLAEGSKICQKSSFIQCTLSDVDTVISDIDLSDIYKKNFSDTDFITA